MSDLVWKDIQEIRVVYVLKCVYHWLIFHVGLGPLPQWFVVVAFRISFIATWCVRVLATFGAVGASG